MPTFTFQFRRRDINAPGGEAWAIFYIDADSEEEAMDKARKLKPHDPTLQLKPVHGTDE